MPIHFLSATLPISVGLSGRVNLEHRVSATLPLAVSVSGVLQAPPRVLSAVPLNSRKVRITFDQPMTLDSLLLSVGNYTVVPLEGGAAACFTEQVDAEAATFPSFVDIIITEMTGGKSYRVAVESGPSAPSNRYGFPLNPGGDTADFTGVGLNPTVVQVAAVGPNRVDIKFSEPMLDNAAIRDASRYTFNNGLIVTSVLEVVGDTVKLATTTQVSGLLYTLTINP